MQVRAERGELRGTRETFAEHFDAWLRGHHRATKVTRDGYRAAGERRLKPFFGPMRLSAINVQTVRNFAAGMVELVEAGELRPRRARHTARAARRFVTVQQPFARCRTSSNEGGCPSRRT
jgi:hypothetical protein